MFTLRFWCSKNNLLNLTKSYSIFLNGGYIVEPSIIKKVVSNDGELIINNDYFKCVALKDDRSYRKPIVMSQKEMLFPSNIFSNFEYTRGRS